MFYEIDRTRQWPEVSSFWELNPGLREEFPHLKYFHVMGYAGNHKDRISPWRSVAARQKHFAYAMSRADCEALDLEWCGERGSVDLHGRSHQYWAAFKNCDWGT